MVRKDYDMLNKKAKHLKRYTDKRIAHISVRKVRVLLKFNDLDPALDYLDKLVIKYELILNAASYPGSIFPSGGEDWIEIFKTPWIDGVSAPPESLVGV